MHATALSLCFVIAVLWISSVCAQAPKNLNWPTNSGARCVPKQNITLPPVCEDYITYDSIYVDDLTPIRSVYGKLNLQSQTWVDPECTITTYRMWCVLTFRPCFEVPVPPEYAHNNNTTVAVGTYPCFDLCEQCHSSCAAAIISSVETFGYPYSIAELAVSCNPLWDVVYGVQPSGVLFFPPTRNSTMPVTIYNGTATFNVTFTCYDANINITTQPPVPICPDGMYFQDGTCSFYCPLPLLTDNQYYAITTMMSVVSWVALVLTTFLAVSYLLDPHKRVYPAVLATNFIVCIMFLTFGFCLGTMVGWERMWCSDDTTFNDFGDPACTIQGLIFVYFTLASVLWWLVIAFNLFLVVVCKMKTRPLGWINWIKSIHNGSAKEIFSLELLFIGYHLFCWLAPLISIIIAMSAQKLGFGDTELWCSIHSSRVAFQQQNNVIVPVNSDPSNPWHLALLTIPVLLSVLAGLILLTFVVIFGFIRSGWKFAVQQWRLFLFMMFYVWIYTFVLSFEIQMAVVANDQYQAWADYINCQSTQANVIDALGHATVSCDLESKANFPLWFIVSFNETAQGLFLFFIFGSSPRVFKVWWYLFTNPKSLLRHSSSGNSSGSGPTRIIGKKVPSTTNLISSTAVTSDMVAEACDMDSMDDESSTDTTSTEETRSTSEGDEAEGQQQPQQQQP